MKLPEHMTIELGPNDKADLNAARRAFIGSMQKLTPEQQLARAQVLSSGIRESDPYTRALAKQVVDGDTARKDIENYRKELAEVERDLRQGGYRPRDPDWRGKALVRQEELQRSIEHAHARLIGIAEDTHATAQKKAAVHFREARQRAAEAAALSEAIARQEAKLDADAIEARAEAIVRGRRLAGGRPTPRNAGESQ